jgi:hypothetical protein
MRGDRRRLARYVHDAIDRAAGAARQVVQAPFGVHEEVDGTGGTRCEARRRVVCRVVAADPAAAVVGEEVVPGVLRREAQRLGVVEGSARDRTAGRAAAPVAVPVEGRAEARVRRRALGVGPAVVRAGDPVVLPAGPGASSAAEPIKIVRTERRSRSVGACTYSTSGVALAGSPRYAPRRGRKHG